MGKSKKVTEAEVLTNIVDTTPDLNKAPAEDWSLPQLGLYVRALAARTALDIWKQGRAITLVRAKGLGHGKYLAWATEYLPYSLRTADRYQKVACLPYEAVVDKSATEVYVLLGMVKPKATKPATDTTSTEAEQVTAVEVKDTSTETTSSTEVKDTTTIININPEDASLLKRLAPVAALLQSIVHDLPSLNSADDITPAINDIMDALQKISPAQKKVAA